MNHYFRVKLPGRMRGRCEFRTCQCRCYDRNGSLCLNCGHGAIWHASINQFESIRGPARKPVYERIPIILVFTPIEPIVPPVPNYCDAVPALPV